MGTIVVGYVSRPESRVSISMTSSGFTPSVFAIARASSGDKDACIISRADGSKLTGKLGS